MGVSHLQCDILRASSSGSRSNKTIDDIYVTLFILKELVPDVR